MSQRFEAEQWIAAPLPQVFAFFADPHNLPRIMPPSQGARVLKLNLVRPHLAAGETILGAEPMAGVGTEIIFKFRAIPYLPPSTKNGQGSLPISRSTDPFVTLRNRDHSAAGSTLIPSKQKLWMAARALLSAMWWSMKSGLG